MTEEEFAELIARGREQTSVEFKGPGLKTDRHLFAKVTRAVLGMANHRDGGIVVVGIEEQQTGLVPTGLTSDQLATWNYDDLADGLAPYADPSVEFDTEVVEYGGQRFLVIRVEEFVEVPVLCKKGYNRDREVILRVGACYIRPRRKPETTEVGTYADMRDLIELATDKGVRRFVARAHAVGIPLTVHKEESDEDLFQKQAEGF